MSAGPCQAETKDGRPCRAPATAGGLCYFHAHPDEARRLGQKGGRKNRQREIDPILPAPLNANGLREILAEAFLDVRAKNLSARSASALAQLAGVLLRVIHSAEWEERIAKLEKAAEDQAPKAGTPKAEMPEMVRD